MSGCVLSLEAVASISRAMLFVLLFFLFHAASRSILKPSPWWGYWKAYIAISILRDLSRVAVLHSAADLYALSFFCSWLCTSGLRITFVAAYLSFAGDNPWRTKVMLLAWGLSVVDIFSGRGETVIPASSDIVGQVVNYLAAGLYVCVIYRGARRLSGTLHLPCLATGIVFATRLLPWSIAEMSGLITAQDARVASLVYGSMTVVAMLMCFLNLNLVRSIKERDEWRAQAETAMQIAATYLEGDRGRPYRTNGGCAGGTEQNPLPGVGAGATGRASAPAPGRSQHAGSLC